MSFQFGRKKKKFRGSVPGRQPTPPPSKEKVDDGEEDEEEDSDDEDLSKYAFDSDVSQQNCIRIAYLLNG